MATTQIGTPNGFAARGQESTLIAAITGNGGANFAAIAVAEVGRLVVNKNYDILTVATGAVRASNRTVVGIYSNGLIQYSGADAPAIAAGDGFYPVNGYTLGGRSNLNGGSSDARSVRGFGNYADLQAMRERLAIINPTLYTTAYLNGLTFNDMVYAIRLNDSPGSI